MARIRASLNDLHPSERRLAEAVLNFPGDVAGYSASEIAKMSGVSNATVSRFVRKIGYASYEEARKAVRDEGRGGAALLRFETKEGADVNALQSHLQQSEQNLKSTFEAIDATAVDDLVMALNATRRLWLAGFRAGHPFATYLGWQVGQVLPNVAVIPRTGETLAETAASIEKDDVLILIALRRSPRSVASLLEVTLAAGARVALISDLPSVEAYDVRWKFSCATASKSPLLNHTGILALCNFIAARTLERSSSAARARLRRIEDLHDKFSEL